ncbi:hypothetical protein V6N11_018553 [Hibiscus sabdariffa]|uniref:Uncharacterized protein n=1 Tax=Hibiscus sabdariffa TaxID=183260 RepID=A0ABR2T7R8_9ROSI
MKNVVILTAYGLSRRKHRDRKRRGGEGRTDDVRKPSMMHVGGTGKTGWRNMKNVVILTAYGLSRRKHRDRKRRGGAGRTDDVR